MSGKTDFSKVNAEIIKNEEAKKRRGGTKTFEKVNWLKVAYGDTTFMVLPPFDEDSNLFEVVYVHHNFVDNNGRKRSYRCSKQLHGRCPICDRVEALEANDQTKEALNIKAQKTFLYNVLDIDLQNKVAGLKPTQHNEVIQEINAKYADDSVDATDPHNGLQVKLTRLRTQPWARARLKGKPIEITEEQATKALAGLKNLKRVYVDNTPEQLDQMLEGEEINPDVVEAREEVEEKQAAPVVAKPAPKAPTMPTKPVAAPVKPVAVATKKVETKSVQKVVQEEEDDDTEETVTDPEVDDIMKMLGD